MSSAGRNQEGPKCQTKSIPSSHGTAVQPMCAPPFTVVLNGWRLATVTGALVILTATSILGILR